MGRVPDQPDGLVAALGQEALQLERDHPVPARDHYAHAATLLKRTIGRSHDAARAMLRSAGISWATEGLSADSGSGADVQTPSLWQKRDYTRPERATHGAYRSARSARHCCQSWSQ